MALTRQTSRRTLILQPSNAEVSTNQVYTPRYEFLVDGELSLPVPRIINSLKHQDAAASIYRVDVSVNKGGTSQYQVVITSYDQLGANPIVHVDQFVTLTTDRLRTTIPVTNAAVGENRSLECTITETNQLVPATDMTVTVIMEDFTTELQLERQGHQIMDAAENIQAQKEVLQFLGSTVKEDTINQRTVVSSGVVGEVKSAMLTEAQMQLAAGPGWIIADGRSVAGSLYEAITGSSTVPDMRGMFLRGKNGTRADAFANPDGDLALGTQTQDKFRAHTHNVGQFLSNFDNGGPADDWSRIDTTGQQNVASTSTGGNETAPKSLTVNYFIKIN